MSRREEQHLGRFSITIWQGGLIILATVSAFPALYGLYHLLRWMKQRSWLSCRNHRSGSSAMSCFVAMQQIIEPCGGARSGAEKAACGKEELAHGQWIRR
jgi:hypothetical protein